MSPDRSPVTTPLTIVFTDIEGSTRLWDADEEAMRQAHERHNRILSDAIAASGGTIVKNRGDGYMAVFQDPIGAIEAAIEAQTRLSEEDWSSAPEPIKVRIAMSTGAAESRDGDFYGSAVNRAARLEAAGHGGQILLAEATRALVVDRLPANHRLVDLGAHRLRGVSREERIYQLCTPGLPDTFPPLKTVAGRGRPLPTFNRGFFGRGDEITEIVELIDQQKRLVTVLGPGGIGKTRLAVETARRLEPRMSGGTFFADLAAVGSADGVMPALADAVGVHTEGAADLVDLVADRITEPTLVIVDNFDRLVAAGTEIARILDASPPLSMMVTSRTPLGIAAERLYRISPLDVISNGKASPAVELFFDRAQAHGVALGDADRPAVESICRRLDGLPLAIELVAARARLLSVSELDEMLATSLDALGSGGTDTPERHRTIRGTIDWSLQALTSSQRSLFSHLAALPAGATLAMAERVVDPGLTAGVLEDLSVLVDHSLVNSATDLPGGTRFRQLAPLREYGLELLEAAGQSGPALDRLIDHYIATSPDTRRALATTGAADEALKVDHPNLMAAMDRSVAAGRVEEMARVMMNIWVYWYNGDRLAAISAWLDRVTASCPEVDWLRGLVAVQRGDMEATATLMSAALDGFSAKGDERGKGLAAIFLSQTIEDPATARPMVEEAGAYFEERGDMVEAVMSLLVQSVLDFFEGDHEAALQRRLACLATAVERDYGVMVAWIHWNLSLAYKSLGRVDEAVESIDAAMRYMAADGYQEGIASCAQVIGVTEVELGRAERGATMMAGADVVFERIGVAPWIEASVANAAATEQARSDLDAAVFDQTQAAGRSLSLKDLVELSNAALAEQLAGSGGAGPRRGTGA